MTEPTSSTADGGVVEPTAAEPAHDPAEPAAATAARTLGEALGIAAADLEPLVAKVMARVGPDADAIDVHLTTRALASERLTWKGWPALPRLDGLRPDPSVRDLDPDLVARAFSALAPRWQLVVWLHVVEGFTTPTLGERLGLSPAAAEIIAARALDALRQAVARSADAADPECAEALPHLAARARGVLPPERAEHVDAHVESCGHCAAVAATVAGAGAHLLAAVLVRGGVAAATDDIAAPVLTFLPPATGAEAAAAPPTVDIGATDGGAPARVPVAPGGLASWPRSRRLAAAAAAAVVLVAGVGLTIFALSGDDPDETAEVIRTETAAEEPDLDAPRLTLRSSTTSSTPDGSSSSTVTSRTGNRDGSLRSPSTPRRSGGAAGGGGAAVGGGGGTPSSPAPTTPVTIPSSPKPKPTTTTTTTTTTTPSPTTSTPGGTTPTTAPTTSTTAPPPPPSADLYFGEGGGYGSPELIGLYQHFPLTVVVANNGPDAAATPVVTVRTGQYSSISTLQSAGWDCSSSERQVRCTADQMAPGAEVTFRFNVRYVPLTRQSGDTTITLSSGTGDPVADNSVSL